MINRSEKRIAVSNLLYYTLKNIKSSYNNNKFEISAKHGENIYNPSIKIYVNKIENIIIFRIKTGFSLELLTPETRKLLGSTEKLKLVKMYGILVLVHGNILNNDYQQDSRVLHTFVPNKPFGRLLEISPKNYMFLKTFNSEFQNNRVWFTDQNSQP